MRSLAGRTQLAHRVAYCEHHGLCLDAIKGKVVRHRCDNPTCVNPEHLELGTQADNMQDKKARGRCIKGTAHHNTKLTPRQVQSIRERYTPRCQTNGQHALAREFGVAQDTVFKIIKGVTHT
ncbi:HNH endonuclease signature motif containing protein (plasmid) [Ralstonia syzygii subsp. celebesensis]|uniref:HNH nuclease domain-containing protein n=1 Tax=blood disease bacterium R229 TaxID=741978 RepID=G2ZVZ1_9RALS|nr:HNH endonuclease signature motif containing protein [Ralstonia syzygii]QQV57848.1 HNH endonuclease [Ralstonia syzygii subsp. celebesensis]CCA83272.1 hypothetical protein BDB_mp60438 [blood disease bacterium R229]